MVKGAAGASLELYDLTGKMLAHDVIYSMEQEVDVSWMASGCYILLITNNKVVTGLKLIIE
jgi:hypothetical protein